MVGSARTVKRRCPIASRVKGLGGQGPVDEKQESIVKKFIVCAGIAGVALAGWIAFRSMMNAPLYRPGSVRAAADADLALTDAGPTTWRVRAESEDEAASAIDLHWFASGEGPNVIVVHGGPGIPFESAPPGLEALTGEFCFVFYDQRGCGRSSRPIEGFEGRNKWRHIKQLEGTLGMAAQIADIERIRRHLGDERVRLVGHSFGGLIAALYAAEFPQRVASLVLVAPADLLVMPAPGDGAFGAIRERLPEDRRAEFDAFVDRYLDLGSIFGKTEAELLALDREFASYWMTAAGSDAEPPDGGGGWMARALYFSLGKRHDWRDALGAVDAPVVVIHGTDDISPRAGSERYVDALPNARLVELDGCGHFPFFDAPERFATVVGEALRLAPAGAKQ